MFTLKTPAFASTGLAAFHSKKTLLFKAEPSVKVDAAKLLAARVCFEQAPVPMKNRSIKMSVWAQSLGVRDYSDLQRADLIVTDEPMDIYGLIDPTWCMTKLKLPVIQARARELGLDVPAWPALINLSPQDRARVLADSITQYCMSQRKSEAELLGYIRLSWDDFAAQYATIVSGSQVLAFPKTQRDTLVMLDTWRDGEGDWHTDEQCGAIIYGEHRQEGEVTVWIVDTKNSKDFFDPRKRNANLFKVDDYAQQERAMSIITVNDPTVLARTPTLSFKSAPSVLRQVSFAYEFPKKTFSSDDFMDLARQLKVRGFSSLTKAELTILMGEVMATQEPTDLTPALIFPNRHSITDVNFESADDVERKGKSADLRSYMGFYGRLISGRAYVPGSIPSPAGRIPTDGQFEEFVGVAPLDIINDVA